MKRITLLAVVLMSVISLQAQERLTEAHVSNFRDWGVSLGFGNTFMIGDLKSLDFEAADRGDDAGFEFGPTVNLGVSKYFSNVWGANVHFQAGQMAGYAGSTGYPRFESTFLNYGAGVSINLNGIGIKGKVYDRKWANIITLGGGWQAGQQDVMAVENGGVTELRGDEPDENWTNLGYLNGNYNLKYRLSNAFDLDFNVGFNMYMGDIADGVRGGSSDDITMFTGVGVTYNFGNKEEGAESNDKMSIVYANPLDQIYGDIEQIRKDYEKMAADEDGDGVSDFFDKDNSTPEGAVVSGSGVAIDSDADGIPDYLDQDPFTAKGAKVDANGRAVDTDGDGVPDSMDKEPNTEAGAMVNFQGVTLPEPKAVGAYLPNVYFSFNSSSVTAANQYRLATIAQAMKANEGLTVKLVGYTDESGPEEYNKNLGMRRAQEAAKQLSQVYGIAESRISTESGGESNPMASGNNSINRRVEVIAQ